VAYPTGIQARVKMFDQPPLLDREARTAQQMWSDAEAKAKYDVRVQAGTPEAARALT